MTAQIKRGNVVSFSASDWTALILLDGADQEVQLPVGQWVPSAMMAASADVAVLVFGDTNTDDGIVLGPYGAVGIQDLATVSGPTFAGLTLVSASAELLIILSDTATATAPEVTRWYHKTSGVPAANFGTLALFTADDNGATNQNQAALQALWTTAAHASRASRLSMFVYDNAAARELIRMEANGSAALIGFLGAAAVARAAAYTQTYNTTTRTHANVTAVDPAAYVAGANGYSTGAMAQAVHAEVIALRADLVVVKNLLNSVIDDLQALGLVG